MAEGVSSITFWWRRWTLHSRSPSHRRGLARAVVRFAHRLHRFRRRADDAGVGVGAGARDGAVLGEEAVPRVDGVRPGLARGGDDVLDDEVALPRGGRADPHRLVAAADV